MTNVFMRFIIFLFPFIKEVFFQNPSFKAFLANSKHLIFMFCFIVVLFFILLFNVEMSIKLMKQNDEIQTKYSELVNKYTIMTNLYGENGSEDPDIVISIETCQRELIALRTSIDELSKEIDYKDQLIQALQERMIKDMLEVKNPIPKETIPVN